MNVLGTQGSGPYRRVIQRLAPCHCMPRSKMPSAPPMIRSAWRNSPGPIVLAKAGTSVVRLLKLVSGILLDGQRVQPRTDAVGLGLPVVQAREFAGEVGLPEGDMANPADPEDHDQLGAL